MCLVTFEMPDFNKVEHQTILTNTATNMNSITLRRESSDQLRQWSGHVPNETIPSKNHASFLFSHTAFTKMIPVLAFSNEIHIKIRGRARRNRSSCYKWLPHYTSLICTQRILSSVSSIILNLRKQHSYLLSRGVMFFLYQLFSWFARDVTKHLKSKVSRSVVKLGRFAFDVRLFSYKGLTNCNRSFTICLNATLLAVYRILFARQIKVKAQRQIYMFQNPNR